MNKYNPLNYPIHSEVNTIDCLVPIAGHDRLFNLFTFISKISGYEKPTLEFRLILSAMYYSFF